MARRSHGHSNPFTPTYYSWAAMKTRCNNPNMIHYAYYGGRGIGYDLKWERFEGFLEDMGERPDGQSLDRIDNDKGYSKENCRWATKAEQARNQRSCVLLTVNGQTKTMTDWARHLGISKEVIYSRYSKLGWSAERTICEPVGRGRREQAV